MNYIYLTKQQWYYAKTARDKTLVIISILFHSLSNGGFILFPILFKILLDWITSPVKVSHSKILTMLGIMLSSIIIFDLFHRIARFLEYSTGCRIRENAVDRFYRHVYNLPMKWHQEKHTGDTLNRIRMASESLFTFIESQFEFIGTVILTIGPFISLLFIALDVALFMMGLVVFTLLITHIFDRILVPIIAKKNERIHKLTATLYDFISNMETLITLGIGRKTEGVLKHRSKKVSQEYRKENSWTQLKCQLLTTMGFFLELGITGYYILTRYQNSPLFSVGTVILIHQYCSLLKNNTITLANHYYNFIRLAENFRAVESILQSPVQEDAFTTENIKQWDYLEFDCLSYRYKKNSRTFKNDNHQVLNDFYLKIERGKNYSLTGPSGSGKSTLLKLLRGLYTPQVGTMKINGKSQKDMTKVHRLVTLIPQSPEIFENTIRYNITLGMEVPEEQLTRILKVAQLSKLINRIPMGLESDIRESGVNLSGGERQRIALARGLIAARESSILLLDEVTSSVDMGTEQEIFQGIFELYPNHCIIASIHRVYLKEMFDGEIELPSN